MKENQILLIDDSREDAMMIERIVKRQLHPIGFTWIGDPEEGLLHLLSKDAPLYLLTLIDIKMPKLTGLELLDELDQAGRLQQLKNITIYSSSDLKRDVDRALKHEGVSFNAKPNGYLEAKSWLNKKITDLMGMAPKT